MKFLIPGFKFLLAEFRGQMGIVTFKINQIFKPEDNVNIVVGGVKKTVWDVSILYLSDANYDVLKLCSFIMCSIHPIHDHDRKKTVLHFMAELNNTFLITEFLNSPIGFYPPFLTARDSKNRTALDVAIHCGHTEIIDILRNHINHLSLTAECKTALHRFCLFKQPENLSGIAFADKSIKTEMTAKELQP